MTPMRLGAGDTTDRRTPRVLLALIALLGAGLLLSSCAAGPNPVAETGEDPAGFWLGLWHGIILPVAFVISLFTEGVNVYEVANNGNWYDFGRPRSHDRPRRRRRRRREGPTPSLISGP